jgi:hypothetical protein
MRISLTVLVSALYKNNEKSMENIGRGIAWRCLSFQKREEEGLAGIVREMSWIRLGLRWIHVQTCGRILRSDSVIHRRESLKSVYSAVV